LPDFCISLPCASPLIEGTQLSDLVDDAATMVSSYQTISEHVDFRSVVHSIMWFEETFATPQPIGSARYDPTT
jgi:hypothetical protein